MDDDGIICDVDHFRVDFIRGWKVLPLNQEARHVFIQHFLSCAKGGAFGLEPHVVPRLTSELVSLV